MKEGITVVNIMADGTICDDLSTYLSKGHQLPEETKRLVMAFIQRGAELRAAEAAAAGGT